MGVWGPIPKRTLKYMGTVIWKVDAGCPQVRVVYRPIPLEMLLWHSQATFRMAGNTRHMCHGQVTRDEWFMVIIHLLRILGIYILYTYIYYVLYIDIISYYIYYNISLLMDWWSSPNMENTWKHSMLRPWPIWPNIYWFPGAFGSPQELGELTIKSSAICRANAGSSGYEEV